MVLSTQTEKFANRSVFGYEIEFTIASGLVKSIEKDDNGYQKIVISLKNKDFAITLKHSIDELKINTRLYLHRGVIKGGLILKGEKEYFLTLQEMNESNKKTIDKFEILDTNFNNLDNTFPRTSQ